MFRVKDLVLHEKVLTWMVVSPDKICTIRQFDLQNQEDLRKE
jgi:hypothetical protein